MNATVTHSRRVSKPLDRFIEVMNALTDISTIPGATAEMQYLKRLSTLEEREINEAIELGLIHARIGGTNDIEVVNIDKEFSLIGATISNNVANTKELKVMNFCEAMKSKDADRWIVKVAKEKERFDKYNVFTIVNRSEIPKNAKILSMTWAMKQKMSGELHG